MNKLGYLPLLVHVLLGIIVMVAPLLQCHLVSEEITVPQDIIVPKPRHLLLHVNLDITVLMIDLTTHLDNVMEDIIVPV